MVAKAAATVEAKARESVELAEAMTEEVMMAAAVVRVMGVTVKRH